MAILVRFLFNPVMRSLLRAGIAPHAFALLETRGRRTGRARLTPVGNGLEDHVFWIVAEHGPRSAYVQNLLANPRVRVKVGRQWRRGSATLLPGDDSRRRRREIERANGVMGRVEGVIFRIAARTSLCTIRVDLAETP